MIKLFEAFAGYGSQHMALKKLCDVESVGISEIDSDVIISYASIHHTKQFEELCKKGVKDISKAKEWLKQRNIGFDFLKGKSSIDRMNQDKINKLVAACVVSKNYGDISLVNKKKLNDEIDIFTYSFPCFVAGTKVLTYNGFKNIEDITSDDYVLTHNNRYRKVVKPMINMTDHLYKLSTMCSDDLYTTEEHPFYVRKKCKIWNNDKRCYNRIFQPPQWVKAKELNKDYYVGIAINQESEIPDWNGVKYEWKDGRKSRESNVLKQKMYYDDFWWIIGRYIGDGWIRHQGGIIICCDKPETNEITNKLDYLKFNYNIVSERTANKIHIPLKELGLYVEQFGRGAKNKRLTQDILNLPISLLKGFLDGYMSADGCITQGVNKATSVSRELIYGIGQCVAKVYDRPFSIYKIKRKSKCVIEERVVNQMDSYNIVWKDKPNKQDKAFYENGYIWCPINKIERESYDGFVYNMEVEEDNSYVVQNIIVHNCQDISVAGGMNGLSEDSGTRSSLLWQCKEFIELNQPKVLLMENVKNLVGKKFINDYNLWLEELEKLGYKNYWKVLNAKDFGVPQNRERVFCVSIRNDIDLEYSFPQPIILEKRLKDILENKVDERYYYNNDKARELTKIIVEKYKKKDIIPCDSTINKPKELEVANCITARYDAGIQNQRSIGVSIVEPVIAETRSDEGVRFFKDNVCGTIRTVQSGGDKIVIEPTNKIIQIGNFVETGNWDNPQRGRVYDTDGISPTICAATTVKPNILEKINVLGNIMPSGHSAGRVIDISGVSPTVMENHSLAITIADTNYRIRKLTPKECWRLMGVSDNDFEQAQKYNSNSALYKQAGNSIVVDVLEFIFKNVVDNL